MIHDWYFFFCIFTWPLMPSCPLPPRPHPAPSQLPQCCPCPWVLFLFFLFCLIPLPPQVTYFLKKRAKKLFTSKGGISKSGVSLHAREHVFSNLVLNSILRFTFFLEARKTSTFPHLLLHFCPLVHCGWQLTSFFLPIFRTSTLASKNNNNSHLLNTSWVSGTLLK